MSTKKKNKKANRRIAIYLFAFITIMIGIFFTFPNYAFQIYQKCNEKENLKEDLVDLKEQQETLEKEVEQLNDNEYIAKLARQKYLFSKDGEIIVKIDDSNVKDNSDNKIYFNLEGYYKYEIGLLVLIAFILLVRKIKKPIKRKSKTRHK